MFGCFLVELILPSGLILSEARICSFNYKIDFHTQIYNSINLYMYLNINYFTFNLFLFKINFTNEFMSPHNLTSA